MNEPLVCLNNIKKSFQQLVLAIEKFEIFPGQCTVITGDNGSGKSTFLKIINGLMSADSGNITFKKQNFLVKRGHILAKNSVYLSSKPYLFDGTVEANIRYPLWLRGRKNQNSLVDNALQWSNLSSLRQRHSTHLSSGEKQRLSLARAYVLNPDIWLLDEPTEHLDAHAKQQLYQLLNKLLSENHSIVIATHAQDIGMHIPHLHLHLTKK